MTGATICHLLYEREGKRLEAGQSMTMTWEQAASCVWSPRTLGILVAHVSVAGWGVDWDGFGGSVPEDPAGLDWGGPNIRQGKRWRDGPGDLAAFGGLGLVHADSGLLQDVYHVWGGPDIPQQLLSKSYDVVRKSSHWDEWSSWAHEFVIDFAQRQLWLMAEWLVRFWMPAVDAFIPSAFDDSAEHIAQAAVNARVSNSGSSWGSALRAERATVERQREFYYQRKLASRGKSAAERALRNVDLALRVPALVRALRPL